jgi:antitoxin component YwqK of YwqJK toxin-antitoxin module
MATENELVEIKKLNEIYTSNPLYVYNIVDTCDFESQDSNDNSDNQDNNYRCCIIIMKKVDDTNLTLNETKSSMMDENYANLKANKLEVVEIFNIGNPQEHFKSIKTYNEILYKKGEMVIADDIQMDNVDSNSKIIRCFRTIDRAFYYRQMPRDYTGKWIEWYESGQKKSEMEYLQGRKHGKCYRWYFNGCLNLDCEYHMNIHIGQYTEYWPNNNLKLNGQYKKGIKEGLWTSYFSDGRVKEHGRFDNGKNDGLWVRHPVSGVSQKYNTINMD